MKRRCFYSFHYRQDSWRVAQVKNIGVIESQPILAGNKWEEVERGGDKAIQKWIDENLQGCSCVVVLVGANTASRPWVKYEIEKGWNSGKGVLGIRIHNLLDRLQQQDQPGPDPFQDFTVGTAKRPLGTWAKLYSPPYATSQNVYGYISDNLGAWVEEAIRLRGTVK